MSEIAQALYDLPRHSDAYAAFVTARAQSGHSGATMSLPNAERPDWAAARPTLHASLSALTPAQGTPAAGQPLASLGATTASYGVTPVPGSLEHMWPNSERDAPRPSQAVPVVEPAAKSAWRGDDLGDALAPSLGDAEGMAACYALVTEARHCRFWATLLARPSSRWFNVAEICSTSDTPAPPGLPPQPLFCAWMDHPWADPALASVVFVSLRDGSNTVVLCRRAPA